MRNQHRIGALVASLMLASLASAQVKYKLYPVGNPAAGSPIDLPNAGGVIDVGNLTADSELHIYDNSGFDDDLGPVLVRGISTGAMLRVKVVHEFDTDAFVTVPTNPLSEGLRNFGGLRFEHPTDPTDTSLRDHAVVAVAVQGDITGDIDAGVARGFL